MSITIQIAILTLHPALFLNPNTRNIFHVICCLPEFYTMTVMTVTRYLKYSKMLQAHLFLVAFLTEVMYLNSLTYTITWSSQAVNSVTGEKLWVTLKNRVRSDTNPKM